MGQDHYGNGALARRDVAFWQRIPLPCTKGKGYRNLLVAEFAAPPSVAPLPGPSPTPPRRLLVFISTAARTARLSWKSRFGRCERSPRRRCSWETSTLAATTLVCVTCCSRRRGSTWSVRITERDDPERIDWILGRGGHAARGGIVPNEASDHPLVWSEFRVGRRCRVSARDPALLAR